MCKGELLCPVTCSSAHRVCGGNLLAKHTFAAACHSSDITAQYGTRPDLCIYAGVPAAMFLANADPEADLAVMRAARENIRQIAPKKTCPDFQHCRAGRQPRRL